MKGGEREKKREKKEVDNDWIHLNHFAMYTLYLFSGSRANRCGIIG